MKYYSEPDSHIRDKVKVILDLSNYATKKELKHSTGVDTTDVAAKKDFIALKHKIYKHKIYTYCLKHKIQHTGDKTK